ncbi:hypothetical protein [Paenibacillus sp. JDR-2]|uniref:hypothetical protein n=1 Tax=Paenibacillus sp. (strain JDR-2) TaxID=324057 RepID=UPI0001668F5E|nr:hypothetical protein [Paenibacillus sp. JDR-2]ACS99650.1 hypothetical protein Pjdr2_0971 [Paenibacillus sp. JDR-2]
MELVKHIMERMPSISVLFSTFLCVAIPMVFYWVSDRMRRHDPPWKQELPTDQLQKTMLPAGSSNDQYEE